MLVRTRRADDLGVEGAAEVGAARGFLQLQPSHMGSVAQRGLALCVSVTVSAALRA